MDKTLIMVMVVLALGLLTIGTALAQTVPSGAEIVAQSDQGQMADIVAETVDLEAGNILNADLNTNQSTLRWAGLYGNASGTLKLADSSEFTMYTWLALGRVVYASAVGAPAWENFADAAKADVVGIYDWLEPDSLSDSYDNTFDNVAEPFDSELFEGETSDYALTYDDTGTPTWKTYSFWDTTNIIFAGLVDPQGTSYTGQLVDYQMIIPEDGTNQNDAATPWTLFMELI